jgi:hypothetical protein
MDATIPPPITAGIQTLSLTKYDVHLDVGVPYQVVLELAADPVQGSPSFWTGGGIEREAVSPELSARLKGSDLRELPALYANEGLWFDALDSISEMIRRTPDDRVLHQHRASLLKQVGFAEVAMRSLAP